MEFVYYNEIYLVREIGCMNWSLDNLKDTQIWLRVGYTLLVLLVLAYLWTWIFYLLALTWLVQTIFWLFSGQVSDSGVTYTRFLSVSFYQYLEYLTYTSKDKPYPISYLP